ncbi:MAG TPA: ATP-dependent protease ATPase subunit HslU [Candidatus Kapabacteria bacterium]|nr:ATP-dependent protease ATPase subunit HslU [Candidatus Kapabacteria bacterium]
MAKKLLAGGKDFTPREIVAELDKYIIGQNDAKKAVGIALRNRWRRRNVTGPLREEIMPNNILLIGPTGVGKTEIARRLARLANAPFVKVEASKFTEVGYVGRDVESMIRDLVDSSVAQIRAAKVAEVRERAEELALQRILDVLVPPLKKKKHVEANGGGEKEDPEETTNERTRVKFLQALREGKLDDKIIEVELHNPMENLPMMQIMGPMAMDDLGINLQEMLGPMMPHKTKKRKMTIAKAREALALEESDKLIDNEAAVREAVERVENYGIVFIDEIDKIAGGGHGNGPDVSREGVQRDLLPIVEGTNVMTKHGMVKSDHILFIASGAFHVSKPSDLIPELQGRFPIRVELKSLTKDDFVKILTIPENALIRQYTAMLEADGVTLEFAPDSILEIANIAAQVNEQVENIGARRLHTVLSTLLEDILFDAPNDLKSKSIKITRELVKKKLSSIVRDQDLSRYIL